jgi:pimeloyl-ACP methyl ester carboxylesterase
VLGLLFAGYLYWSCRATGFDKRILRSDSQVIVSRSSETITFAPAQNSQPVHLLFIPGALVDPDAYAPLAHFLAESGYPAIILRLPYRLASTDAQRNAVVLRAHHLMAATPGVRWVVAGHSLGGVIAARVARDYPQDFAALLLLGTSHPRDFDLSRSPLDVTKIYASNDGLASPAEVLANARLLPPATHWILIDGGNHSQFAYYGFQLGDHRAKISRAQQQAIIRETFLETFQRIAPPAP